MRPRLSTSLPLSLRIFFYILIIGKRRRIFRPEFPFVEVSLARDFGPVKNSSSREGGAGGVRQDCEKGLWRILANELTATEAQSPPSGTRIWSRRRPTLLGCCRGFNRPVLETNNSTIIVTRTHVPGLRERRLQSSHDSAKIAWGKLSADGGWLRSFSFQLSAFSSTYGTGDQNGRSTSDPVRAA